MADRYQNRPLPAADNYDRGDDRHGPGQGESDPLAELARLIGQTDPFAGMGRANQQVSPRAAARETYQPPQPPAEIDDGAAAGPPPWMQRAARHETPQQDYLSEDDPTQDYPQQDYPNQDYPSQDYPSSVHPLQRYATPHAAPEQDYDQPFADADQPHDPSRYDDALYGQFDTGAQQAQHDPAYPEDPYGYQDGYGDGAEDQVQKRRGGMVTVMVVLALAVVGTGAAFAYRSYVGSPRTGEPPIIKADTAPTKIIPATDGTSKVPDRLAAGDGMEKIVPREEAPVDVNARSAAQSGPRVVFPPLNQNANPPSAASVAPGALPPAGASNGTLPNNEPHRIKTFSVRGDQPDGGVAPAAAAQPSAAKPAPAARVATPAARSPSAANASANAPLSLAPGAQPAAVAAPEPRTQIAANTPAQIAPSPAATSAGAGGGYLVQVSSQRNEADAQASYKSLQGKFPSVLGSRAPVIKRADLGEKGVYYRAMVGPFGSPDEASQFCGSLKSAGGQCVVQRN
jgi:SPOR domain